MEIGITIFTTVLSGVTVFILGQTFLKMVIEPIQKLKNTIANVAHCLRNDASIFMNADIASEKESHAIYKKLRDLGSQLNADLHLIPFYGFFHRVFGLPNFSMVQEASDKLFAMSYHMFSKNIAKYEYLDLYLLQACKNLHIFVPEKMKLSEDELKETIKELRKLNK